MRKKSRIAVEISRNQFDSSFKMLCTLVDVCPDAVWETCYYGFPYPVWYQVYHVAYFVDYWLRESYDNGEFRCMAFDERIPPEYEQEVPAEVCVSREEMRTYLKMIGGKVSKVFDVLDDSRLMEPIRPGEERFTHLDVIMTQVRHVMYNVGYVNGILRGLDLPESDWYAYNEDEA